jgi:hypothetical protein
MWYREIIVVYSVTHTKYILTLYRQKAELLNAEATGLRRVNFSPSYVVYLRSNTLFRAERLSIQILFSFVFGEEQLSELV